MPLVGRSISSSLDISSTSDVSAAINSITNAVGVVYANGPGAKRTINVYSHFQVHLLMYLTQSR